MKDLGLNIPGQNSNPDGFLYIGSLGSALNNEALKKAGITHIVIADPNTKPAYPEEFKYHVPEKVGTEAEGGELNVLANAAFFIGAALSEGPRTKVLIHCFMGKVRAPSFALAYIIKDMRIPLDTCLAQM
jgi:protein-tyrosine phosphatase